MPCAIEEREVRRPQAQGIWDGAAYPRRQRVEHVAADGPVHLVAGAANRKEAIRGGTCVCRNDVPGVAVAGDGWITNRSEIAGKEIGTGEGRCGDFRGCLRAWSSCDYRRLRGCRTCAGAEKQHGCKGDGPESEWLLSRDGGSFQGYGKCPMNLQTDPREENRPVASFFLSYVVQVTDTLDVVDGNLGEIAR